MNIVLVYNPHSGTSRPLSKLRRTFATHDITIKTAIDITKDFPGKLRPLIKKGTYVAAIGGDGTLSSVAAEVYATEAIFIPLPGGTLNHFTKDVGIAQDLDTAIAALASAKPHSVDVALVNDKLFLNNSSIGIYPTSLRTRGEIEDRLGKWPSAIIGTIRALIRFKLYTVTIEGETFKTPFIFIGNNEYHLDEGGTRDSLKTGKLCAYAIRSPRRSTLVTLLLYALFRKLRDADEFIIHRDTQLTIQTKRTKVTVSADGELLRLSSPLVYRSLQSGLTILS